MTSIAGLTCVQAAFGSSFMLPLDTNVADSALDARSIEMVRYPQKTDLILLTDRPPQLETPLELLSQRPDAQRCFLCSLASGGNSDDG